MTAFRDNSYAIDKGNMISTVNHAHLCEIITAGVKHFATGYSITHIGVVFIDGTAKGGKGNKFRIYVGTADGMGGKKIVHLVGNTAYIELKLKAVRAKASWSYDSSWPTQNLSFSYYGSIKKLEEKGDKPIQMTRWSEALEEELCDGSVIIGDELLEANGIEVTPYVGVEAIAASQLLKVEEERKAHEWHEQW